MFFEEVSEKGGLIHDFDVEFSVGTAQSQEKN